MENFLKKVKDFFRTHFFNQKWRCASCNEEIFSGKYFCEECEKKLPYIDSYHCEHCGRELKTPSNFCTSCKGKMLSVDKARSVFNYKNPISNLIMQLKYFDKRYLARVFSEELANLYRKNYFNADFLCYVPMTKKALKKRGFNQGELIATLLSEKINVPVKNVLIKTKETTRQAKLTREERLKNLQGCFKAQPKKEINGKTIVLVDDVLTTGATSETVANLLKKKGANAVYLITVASVPSKDGY